LTKSRTRLVTGSTLDELQQRLTGEEEAMVEGGWYVHQICQLETSDFAVLVIFHESTEIPQHAHTAKGVAGAHPSTFKPAEAFIELVRRVAEFLGRGSSVEVGEAESAVLRITDGLQGLYALGVIAEVDLIGPKGQEELTKQLHAMLRLEASAPEFQKEIARFLGDYLPENIWRPICCATNVSYDNQLSATGGEER
jgi:hypothetical protein